MKKGFTLIELLAVIVILAIIALIATPIILGIINDARKESNERSVELYASAVKNAIASYQLTHPNAPETFEDLDVQYDGNVVCGTKELYKDGSFYIIDCTVNGDEVDYTYGRKKYEPQYYGYTEISGTVDLTAAPANPSNVPPIGKDFYLGYDVGAGNKVTAAYVCFTRNETEYCLKGVDAEAFAVNTEIIKEAFKENACSFDENSFSCDVDSLYIRAHSNGDVTVDDGSLSCEIYSDKGFAWLIM